ncbi:hypothetical protein L916_09136 [Phytophthora nicotianae]|uniref:Uncharacterized protein n=1 Tax=Phytophthora nicotianae TaxID=4792 RepID=W2J166_PHYNI|nr:hypothetical protein L916_09136 [Phytophthora nicotianae]
MRARRSTPRRSRPWSRTRWLRPSSPRSPRTLSQWLAPSVHQGCRRHRWPKSSTYHQRADGESVCSSLFAGYLRACYCVAVGQVASGSTLCSIARASTQPPRLIVLRTCAETTSKGDGPLGKVVPRRQAVQERGARGCPGGRLHPYPKEQPLLSDFFNEKETIKSINSYAAVVHGSLPF